jgi:hypothetical protein
MRLRAHLETRATVALEIPTYGDSIATLHHCVYVIELRPEVLQDRSYARANPQHRADKPCLYVGMSGLSPSERFARHRAGIQANDYVRDFGVRLRPRLYARFNPMSYEDAKLMEVELARRLRNRGFAVWQK